MKMKTILINEMCDIVFLNDKKILVMELGGAIRVDDTTIEIFRGKITT